MAARIGCRFWGPTILVLIGPMSAVYAGEGGRDIAEPSPTAVVQSRADSQRVVASDERSPETLVREALKAEAAGKSSERETLLRRALEKDPDCAQARWHLGYVRVGKEWLKWDEVQRRSASDPRLVEYRRLFDEQAGTPTGELALARWCREQGLDEQARFHWRRVIGYQPQNEEALRALGMRWHQGQLLTHEQIVARRRGAGAQAEQQQARRKDWARHWAPRVTKWQRMVQENDPALSSSIREELQALGKPSEPDFWAAIQGLDSVLILRSQRPKDADACRRLSLKWIEVVVGMSDPRTAFPLAQLAVDHPSPEVRAAAADAMKSRRKPLYVPQLIARMGTPIEARFAMTRLPLGGGVYEQSLFREGIDADYEEVHVHSVSARGAGPRFDPPPPSGYRQTDATRQADANNLAAQRIENRIQMAQATMRAEAVAAANSAATQRRVEQVNAVVRETNERVREALCRATGMDFGEHPRPWFEWWTATCSDYFDMESASAEPGEKPIVQQSSGVDEYTYTQSRAPTSYQAPPAPAPKPSTGPHHALHWSGNQQRYVCCFPRGTTVWTLTGSSPIENVKPGDRVLSQHPATGELSYKPVIATTTRRPQALTRISLGSEVLAATRGHPFLVAGEGWKMARHLKAGMRLHGLAGSVLVDHVEDVAGLKPFFERLAEKPDADASDDLAFNLVVDESHTYFVGQHRVLVFDDRYAALADPTLVTLSPAK